MAEMACWAAWGTVMPRVSFAALHRGKHRSERDTSTDGESRCSRGWLHPKLRYRGRLLTFTVAAVARRIRPREHAYPVLISGWPDELGSARDKF